MDLQISPGVYRREKGALAQAGAYARLYGTDACLIGGRTAMGVAGPALRASLASAGVAVTGDIYFSGQCSWSQVERLAQLPAVQQADVLFGIGGGKALDTSKLLAYKLKKPLITVPTVAATCAAWTPLSVVYDEQGAFVEVSYLAANPKALLADTDILVNAPEKFLIAGIGDTLAKWYEGESCTVGRTVSQNGQAGLSIAKMVCDRLLAGSRAAVAAAVRRQADLSFEEAVDAIIMYAGLVSNMGGDACRSAAAHAIYSGLTVLEPVHHVLHGAVVSFGILCEMIMDGKPEAMITGFIAFSRQTGLPVTLAELNLAGVSRRELAQAAAAALNSPEMAVIPYPVTADMVLESIIAADAKGREWLSRQQARGGGVDD